MSVPSLFSKCVSSLFQNTDFTVERASIYLYHKIHPRTSVCVFFGNGRQRVPQLFSVEILEQRSLPLHPLLKHVPHFSFPRLLDLVVVSKEDGGFRQKVGVLLVINPETARRLTAQEIGVVETPGFGTLVDARTFRARVFPGRRVVRRPLTAGAVVQGGDGVENSTAETSRELLGLEPTNWQSLGKGKN